MKINEIPSTLTSNIKRKRRGRGSASGLGKTAGRGVKGQKSRSGVSINGFEGGQMPLQRRVPKFGFTNPNRVAYKGINLDTIQALVDDKKIKSIDTEILVSNGLARKKDLVKILGRGELTAKVDIQAHAYSASAKAAIEKNGGKAEVIGGAEETTKGNDPVKAQATEVSEEEE